MENKLLNSVSVFILILLVSTSVFAEGLKRQTFLNKDFATKDKKVRVAFFDADSTLRVSISGSVTASSPTDVMLLPQVETKIGKLIQEGYLVAIVSNQGGIKVGAVTHEIADSALFYTIEKIRAKNPLAQIHYFDYAENDETRKPDTDMGLRLEKKLNELGLTLDWENSFMVGDSAYKKGKDLHPDGRPGTHFSNADRLFAENLKIPFYEPNDFFGWRSFGIDVFEKAKQVKAFLKKHNSALKCVNAFND